VSYNFLKIFLTSTILLYFYMGFYFSSHTSEGEAYPFFSWFVFTRVPPQFITGYALKIVEYEGKKLDPPVFFQDSHGIYFKKILTMTEYDYTIRVLGENIERGETEKVEQYRKTIEESFLSQPVVYEIVRIEFDTLKYWKTGQFTEGERIATLTAKEKDL